MNIADFATLGDFDKLVVFETLPARSLEDESWTISGGGPAYYIDLTDGEIVSTEIDGEGLTEVFSASDCASTASSFYWDDYSERLYIHTPDSDSPETTITGDEKKYCIIVYFWVGFANRAKSFQRYDQLVIDPIFNFWDSSTDLEFWIESIAGSSTVTRDTDVYDETKEAYSVLIEIDGSSNTAQIRQDVSTKPRRKCKLKVRYKAPTGSGTAFVQDTGSNVYLNTSGTWQTGATTCLTLANTSEWTDLEIEFVSHADYSDYRIGVRSTVANAEVYISHVEFYRYRQPVYYKPLLGHNSIPMIRQSTGFYYRPQSQIQLGDIQVINDGWFWDIKDTYLWHNQEAILKLGESDTDYEDLAVFFSSRLQKPAYGTSRVVFGIQDIRITLKQVPEAYFDATTYPNCEEVWANKPIPILFGTDIENITPPCCDETNHVYKVSQTVFDGTTYALNAINAVYDDGVLQTAGVDYNTNLSAGTFTLTGAPGGVITCDSDGVCVDWEDGTLGAIPADFVYFVLVILNGISKHRLNIAALKDLDTSRVLAINEYINSRTESLELLNKWQIAAVFQVIPQLDGTISALRYSSTIPDDVLLFKNEDFKTEIKETEDTDHIYKYVVIKYNQDPTIEEWKETHSGWAIEQEDQDKIGWKYKREQTLEIQSNLRYEWQSMNLFDSYSAMVQTPISLFETTLPVHSLLLNPGDKIKVSYSKIYNGEEKIIYDEEDFQIMTITKNVNDGTANIMAFKHYGDLFWLIT